jgi:hypothetical protein
MPEITHSTHDWIEAWAQIPTDALGEGFPGHTCGVAYAARAGKVAVLARSNPAVFIFDLAGRLEHSWGNEDLPDGHGLTAVSAEGADALWITDRSTGHVGLYTLEGERLQTLPQPEHARYAEKAYKPTWVAQNPETGDIWLADGYGAHLVHLYDADGRKLATFDGEADGLGAYRCPHGLAFKETSGGRELWVTDRGANRLRVYDESGRFLRVIEGIEGMPCAVAFRAEEDLTAVPLLKTGLTVLKGEEIDGEVGAHSWNRSGGGDESERPADADDFLPWRFNCPHAATFLPDGSLLVSELVDGGRVTKLAPKP